MLTITAYKTLGFPTRFLPILKNWVTQTFFKTEKVVLGQLENRFFGFVLFCQEHF
jgi:hypothetical protein